MSLILAPLAAVCARAYEHRQNPDTSDAEYGRLLDRQDVALARMSAVPATDTFGLKLKTQAFLGAANRNFAELTQAETELLRSILADIGGL